MKSICLLSFISVVSLVCAEAQSSVALNEGFEYFPPPDVQGGWRTLKEAKEIKKIAGMDLKRLDDVFQFIRTTTKNGGLLVVRHGYLVYENYFGKGQREAAPNLGSCGKSFTSIAVGILMRERPDLFPEGLDQKIFTPEYMPPMAFPLPDPRMADIKLGQLLTFSAGIRGNNPVYVKGKPATIYPPGPDGWFALVDEYALGIEEGSMSNQPFSTKPLWCEPGDSCIRKRTRLFPSNLMARETTRSFTACSRTSLRREVIMGARNRGHSE